MSVRKETADGESIQAFGELTSPFGLKRHLKAPEIKLDMVPLFDLIVLALLIGLLFTRYLVFPGVRVDLPNTELSIQQNAVEIAVLTISNSGMLFFDGSVYQENSIEQAFQKYIENSGAQSPVLLVKAGASMDIQNFLELCQMARKSGFDEVQVAADPKQPANNSKTGVLRLPGEENGFVFPTR